MTASIRLSFLVCHWHSAFLAGAADLRHGSSAPPRRPSTSSVP
jgi:hypothetical protein